MLQSLVTMEAADLQCIDSTTSKAHRCSAGDKGGADAQAIGRSRGGRTTTSPVEGQNSRLKMLKRTMYGRAGIKLLRARVLHAA
jgi:hypothetical protein